jgi:nucleotide-binding universal stress UspA family protein
VTYAQVLVGTDGSPTATHAVTTASRLAVALEVPLVVVTAWQRRLDDPPTPSEEASYPAGGGAAGSEAAWATTTTTEAAAIARKLGVTDVRQSQPIGGPGDALLQVAEEHPDALLVLGTYGLAHRTERLVGNVPHAMTHHSPIDLLLSTGSGDAWKHIGLATDGSPTAALAVRRGLELARAIGAEASLLTAARSREAGDRTLADVTRQLPETAELPRRVAEGPDASKALSSAARDLDLLVIGNKGMSGPSRLLGSVANRITHDVPTDLLLVNTTR